jgi:glutaredoxin 3
MAEIKDTTPEVEIYTTMWCPYCSRAKALLRRKGVEFNEIDVSFDQEKRVEMTARAYGRTSVPEIFIGGALIGGSDELHALDTRGELDRLLGRTSPRQATA